jgi:hypothetical protein
MMPRLIVTSVAILVLSVGNAARAAAQGRPPAGPRLTAPWASVTGARGLPVGQRLGADLMQRASRPRAPGTVLMIVGGAVAGAGILADESLLIVGGVAVAGYGLYLYLR